MEIKTAVIGYICCKGVWGESQLRTVCVYTCHSLPGVVPGVVSITYASWSSRQPAHISLAFTSQPNCLSQLSIIQGQSLCAFPNVFIHQSSVNNFPRGSNARDNLSDVTCGLFFVNDSTNHPAPFRGRSLYGDIIRGFPGVTSFDIHTTCKVPCANGGPA